MQAKDFEGTTPRLDLFDYFAGDTRAWGIFESRSGELKRQFTVDIRGEVEGDSLTLTEDFVYADGETQQRIWRIRRLDEHRFEGRADDVVGTANGLAYGQALNWRYTLRLPFRDSTLEVKFDDWMYLQPDGVLINRATVSKFGFKVGEVTLFFSKGAKAV
ncbi:MAG: DUF3833 domain-containing protein [Gammaproteobacteria bacterium]|jgi:hypothetical protein|nr:DUF3833 domain-containing protein [Gammaproteobacteria bacterium]